jgi:hypothetical protein
MKNTAPRFLAAGTLLTVAFACGEPSRTEESSGPEAAAGSAVQQAEDIPSNPLRDAFFGETHLHTAYSLDAYIGGTRIMPGDAYRYAKGEPVEVGGVALQLGRPLDFVAVTDHAE